MIHLLVVLFTSLLSSCQNPNSTGTSKPIQSNENQSVMTQLVDSLPQQFRTVEGLEIATLGAGCFWCVEAVFQDLKGVSKVESGYSNGQVKNPSYREVCTGTTGHAEVCQITFDPKIISFAELLEVFWTSHDPTTLNRQGNDSGTQYRSGVYAHSKEQLEIANKSKSEVAPTIWEDPIVTEVVPIHNYYPAENYHQEYYNNNPDAGYCRIVIAPKVAKVRKQFADKLK